VSNFFDAVEDKLLYQYRTIGTAQQLAWLTSLMDTGKIFCSHIRSFNDPFESLSVLSVSVDEIEDFIATYLTDDIVTKIKSLPTPKDDADIEFEHFYNGYLIAAFDELIKNLEECREEASLFNDSAYHVKIKKHQVFKVFNARINELLQIGGVACFTQDPENPTMWAHYADEHKGVCVEFDLSNLSKKKTESLRGSLFQVDYSKSQPADACKIIFQKLKDDKHLSTGSLILDFRRQKMSPWAYEGEWRLATSRRGAARVRVHNGIGPPPIKEFDIVLNYENTPSYEEFLSYQRQGKSILIVGMLNRDILSLDDYDKLLRTGQFARPTLGKIPSFLTKPYFHDFVRPSKIILGYAIDKDVKHMLDKTGDELGIATYQQKIGEMGLSKWSSNKKALEQSLRALKEDPKD